MKSLCRFSVCLMMFVVLPVVCNTAKGGLITTANTTANGQKVTDLSLALGGESWTFQIAVLAELTPLDSGAEQSFRADDSYQYWDTRFQITGGAVPINQSDVISLKWVDKGIDEAFQAFSQPMAFDKAYTGYKTTSGENSAWMGSIQISRDTSAALRGDYTEGGELHRNIYQIGTIEVSYDSSKLSEMRESDYGAYTLAVDQFNSQIQASIGYSPWWWRTTPTAETPMFTFTLLKADGPEPGPVPSPEPGTWAMIGGMAMVGCAFLRRRAKQGK